MSAISPPAQNAAPAPVMEQLNQLVTEAEGALADILPALHLDARLFHVPGGGRAALIAAPADLGAQLDAALEPDLGPRLVVEAGRDRDLARALGATVEAIAREKAGIFKRGVPAAIGPLSARARRVT